MEASNNTHVITRSAYADNAVNELKKSLLMQGISITEAAKTVNLARQTLSKKLNRDSSLSIDEFASLAISLGKTPSEIFKKAEISTAAVAESLSRSR